MQLALKGITGDGADFAYAQQQINQAVRDFYIPVQTASEGYIGLAASAKAAGFGGKETATIFRGLAAANVALGGDAEKLQGILLASSQVISKGKVAAEELRGQIGERLPGAFALFAKATGRSTAELDKALEQGEVSLDDFYKFAAALLAKYEGQAAKIGTAPENAGQRLNAALTRLQNTIGGLLAPIGAAFQDFFTDIVNGAEWAARALGKLAGMATDRKSANDQLYNTRGQIKQTQAAIKSARQQGLGNQRGSTVLGVDGQVLGGGAPVLPGLQYQLQQLQQRERALNQQLQSYSPAKPSSSKPQPTPPSGGGGGGGGRSGGGAKPKDNSIELATLQGSVSLKRQLLDLDQQIYGARLAQSKEAEFDLEFQKRLLEGNAKIEEITRTETDAKIRAQKIEEARLDTMASLRELTFGMQQLEQERKNTFDDMVQGLQDQTALAGVLNEESRKSLELEQKLAQLRKDNPWMSDEQIAKLKVANQELDKLTKKADAIKAQQQQLDDLYSGIASEIAGGIGGAIDAVAASTDNLAESLQGLALDILKAVGKMLIFYALAQAFGALGGKDDVGVFSYLAKAFGGGRASGGPVEPNTSYLVGERGPELLTLGSSGGFVHNNSSPTTQSAMSRYSPANGGATAAQAEAGGSSGGSSNTVDVTYTVERINERNYVTEEAFQSGMRQAARQGAEGGYNKTMGSLKNSRSQRSRIGLR